MKRSILLFTSIAFIGYLTLSSYQDGPANPSNGSLNVTGGPGSSGGTCNQLGCHVTSSTSSTVQLTQLKDVTKGWILTGNNYIPGDVYEITVSSFNPAFTWFGFQLEMVTAGGAQAGSLFTTTGDHITRTVAGRTILEHSQPINAPSHAQSVTFTWNTAVTPVSGPVSLYAVFNWVNHDGTTAGDQPSAVFIKTFNPVLAVSDLSEKIKITAYPNPATDYVNVKLDGAERGSYTINVIDVTGKKIASETIQVNQSELTSSMSTINWAKGLNFIQVVKDGAQRMIPVSKL
jgi:hypothetical protein